MTRIWLVAVLAGLALPATAHAATPPQCPGGKLTGPPNAPISLASLTCTNVSTNFQIIVDPWPEHGDFTGPPYAYVPDKDFHGTDQFKYTVMDNETHETSTPATVDLLVDTAPTCDDGAVTTAFNTAVKSQPACRDADGDALTLVLDSAPGHGTLGADLTYTPAAGFSGTDAA